MISSTGADSLKPLHIAIHVAGKRRGTWHCFETGTGGGVLALVKREHGGDPRAWLADRSLIQRDYPCDYEARDRAPARQQPPAPPPAGRGAQYPASQPIQGSHLNTRQCC